MPSPRTRIVMVVVLALAISVFGVIRLLATFGTAAEATAVATVDGLSATVTTAKWIDMDMTGLNQGGAGFQMPAQMMPGMPKDGEERFSVSVSLTNTTGSTRPFLAADEFALYAGKDPTRRQLAGDTFGDLPRLPAHNAVNGVLMFDLPAADLTAGPAWLQWNHDGTTTRLTLPINGAIAPPNHGGHSK